MNPPWGSKRDSCLWGVSRAWVPSVRIQSWSGTYYHKHVDVGLGALHFILLLYYIFVLVVGLCFLCIILRDMELLLRFFNLIVYVNCQLSSTHSLVSFSFSHGFCTSIYFIFNCSIYVSDSLSLIECLSDCCKHAYLMCVKDWLFMLWSRRQLTRKGKIYFNSFKISSINIMDKLLAMKP